MAHAAPAEKGPTTRAKLIRFFKVTFGKDRDKFMKLPLDFAPNVENMAGETFLLRDADGGGRWPVKLTRVEGSLAFASGWCLFSDDHRLVDGSFLVFEYAEGSKSLTVRVFEKSGREASAGTFRRRFSTNGANPDDYEDAMSDESSPEKENRRESAANVDGIVDSDVGSVDELIELDEEDCSFEENCSSEIRIAKHGKRDGDSDIGTARRAKKDNPRKDASVSKAPIFFGGVTRNFVIGESSGLRANAAPKIGEGARMAKKKSHNTDKGGGFIENMPEKKNDTATADEDHHQHDGTLGSFSVLVKSQDFLELPRGSRNGWKHQHVIYLQGLMGRIWPVACHVERSGKRLLSANWKKFCVENDVADGDTCWFHLYEDTSLKQYRVDVSCRCR